MPELKERADTLPTQLFNSRHVHTEMFITNIPVDNSVPLSSDFDKPAKRGSFALHLLIFAKIFEHRFGRTDAILSFRIKDDG